MSIGIDIGNGRLELESDGDLRKFLRPGFGALLHLGETLRQFTSLPNAELKDFPEGAVSAGFSTDQSLAWDLGKSAGVVLRFEPEAAGTIRVTKSGPIFEYFEGDDALTVDVPPGQVCISVLFRVGFEAAAGGSYAAGSFGVQAELSAGNTFILANHRCFPADTKLVDGIRRSFEMFTLPFNPESILRLGESDLLEFEFIGNLQLGFGLTYGFNAPMIGGRSAGEISRSFGNQLVSGALRAIPTVQATAGFAVKYAHEDAFRFVFGRDRSGGNAGVSLTIFRMDQRSLQTKQTLGIVVDPGLKFDFRSRADQALGSAVDRLFGNVADGEQAAERLKQKLRDGSEGAVRALTGGINSAVNALLDRAVGKVELELMQERVRSNASLFRLHFDLDRPGVLDVAIRAAMQGRIADALEAPGVDLAPGSLVERAFIERSSFTFELFDLWKWRDMVEYVDKIRIEYAGNRVLRLIGTQGVVHSSGVFGRESQCNLFFRAEAKQRMGASEISDLDVTLNFELLDRDSRNADDTRRVIEGMGQAALMAAASQIEPFLDGSGEAVRTSSRFAEAIFARFKADGFTRGKPGPLPHLLDAANYQAFVEAVERVHGSFLGFPTYEGWATFNRVANDRQGSTRIPDRKNSGNLAAWPNEFIGVDRSRRDLMRFHSESARHFMNLCASLENLCSNLDEVSTEAEFTEFLESINGIVRNDVPPAFIKATFLALTRLANAPVSQCTTEVDDDTLAISFTIAGVAVAAS